MHAVVREAERLQAIGVHVADVPAIETAEQTFARHQRFEVGLEVSDQSLGFKVVYAR